MDPVIASAQHPDPFGGVHLALLVSAALLSALTLWATRRIRGSAREDTVLRNAGWLLLILSLLYTGWLMLPANWNLEQSLPLHYSDALRFITAVALIRQSRWAVAVAYYWGLTLNTQAILTPHPTMLMGPSVHTTFYWVLHIAVLLAALALIWGAGHRPQWRHYAAAYGIALGWAALVIPVNAMLGTNYGFLNRHPDGASLLDVLGPWPVYVLWVAVLTGGVWALMTWLWTRRKREKPALCG